MAVVEVEAVVGVDAAVDVVVVAVDTGAVMADGDILEVDGAGGDQVAEHMDLLGGNYVTITDGILPIVVIG
jgi:hypothetical protein